MTDSDKIVRNLGKLLAEDSQLEELSERLASQKTAFLNRAVSPPTRQRSFIAVFIAASFCAAAAAAFFIYSNTVSSHDPIEFYTENSTSSLAEGYFVKTGSNQSETISFLGEHRFKFAEQTKARVVKAASRKVIVDVQQGDVLVDIVPGSEVTWILRAGPYEITVKGTSFSVHWNDPDAMLFVSVSNGKVAVRGPGMEDNGVLVSAGNSLKAESNRGRITFEQNDKIENGTLLANSNDILPVTSFDLDSTNNDNQENEISNWTDEEESAVISSKSITSGIDWKTMYSAKDYAGIFSSAEKRGLSSLERKLPKEDLWIVANSARYMRKAEASDRLFEVFRSRFPASAQAKTAAFLLAKSSLDNENFKSAKNWFETYLKESPDGPLSEEAHGRLIYVYSKIGDQAGAERSARVYLEKYKGGYFTKQAKMTVKN